MFYFFATIYYDLTRESVFRTMCNWCRMEEAQMFSLRSFQVSGYTSIWPRQWFHERKSAPPSFKNSCVSGYNPMVASSLVFFLYDLYWFMSVVFPCFSTVFWWISLWNASRFKRPRLLEVFERVGSRQKLPWEPMADSQWFRTTSWWHCKCIVDVWM